MRLSVCAALLCLSVVGLSLGADAHASIRKTISIPAQGLGPALNAFAKERDLQVVYRSEIVGSLRTKGASGDLTVDEALKQLLSGTGLTYRYIDDKTVTILPNGRAWSQDQGMAPPVTGDDLNGARAAAKEGKKDSSSGFRLAQLDQGKNSQSSSVDRNTTTYQDGSKDQLEEVIVSATRRDTNLQNVSASVTAIGGVELANRGITSFDELAFSVPSLSFTETGEGFSSARTISIRGVSSESNINIGETTGFYIDDTPIPYAVDPKFFDIDRIEVLRGPQGSLYGARSMGGTVKIVTNTANLNTTEGSVAADGSHVAGGGAGYFVNGSGNFPIIPGTAAVRISAFDTFTPGIQNKLVTSTDREYLHVDDFRSQGVMLSGLWDFAGGWELTPKFIYQHSTNNGLPYADYQPGNTWQVRDQNVAENGEDRWNLGSLTLHKQMAGGNFTITASHFNRAFTDREDASEFIQFIAANVFESSYTGPSPTSLDQTEKIWTYEGRFVSAWQGPLQLVAGLYYQDRNKTRDFLETAPGFGVATGTGTDLIFDGGDKTDEKEAAIYGEATYHFAEQWEATVGARSFDANVYLNRLTGGLFGGQRLDDKTHNSLTTPKFSITYIPGNDMRFYALASEGYRLGGDNFTVPTASACATSAELAAYEDLHSGTTFKPDSLWNYELGSKMEMLDRRIRVNAAVFLIDWKDIQQNVNACGFNLTVNAGTAQIRGAEFEAEAALGFGTTLGLSGSRLDAKLTESVPGVATNGARVLGVPDWQANVYLNWSVPAWSDWKMFVRPQITYTGSEEFTFTPVAYDPSNEQGGTTQYDLRLGLTDSAWSVALYGTNLSDVRRSLGPNTSLAAELPGRPRLGVNPSRTVGVHVMRSF